MSPEKRRAISSKGGKSGKGHRWTSKEASEAGKKGGAISRRGPAREEKHANRS